MLRPPPARSTRATLPSAVTPRVPGRVSAAVRSSSAGVPGRLSAARIAVFDRALPPGSRKEWLKATSVARAWLAAATAAAQTALLNALVGDSGSGGTKGLVPAPAAGDAAAGKFLKADGTWATGGGFTAAVQSDMETGTSTTVGVVPGVAQYHASACKAWARFTGVTTTALAASYNVSSLTDNGTGDTTVNFTVAFSSANYGIATCPMNDNATGVFLLVRRTNLATAAGSCRLQSQSTAGALTDIAENYCAFYGDQ